MRILVIGLDAATMDLIEPWIAAGQLPTLARLMAEGVSGRMISTPNMHSASAWTSILTGLNPGRHGLFVFSDRDFQTGRQMFFTGSDRAGAIISSHLARHGMTAGLVNVPMTYKAECSPGGFMISGLDAPALNEHAFCPEELRNELFNKFPDYNFAPPAIGELMKASRIDEAVSAWLKLIDSQTAAVEWLIETRPTDFFMTVYTASDWAGHNLWKYLDADRKRNAQPGNQMFAIYRALDMAIARLLAHTTIETQIYIISDHGMGPHTGASYHLADWLESKGYMRRAARKSGRASLISVTRTAAQGLLPAKIKEKIKSGIGAERVKRLQSAEKDSFYNSIEWSRTIAYTEPGRHVININLAGRNQSGIVVQDDYDKVCEDIIRDLSEWTDARGNSVVERVVRRDEVYFGPFTERASDLYIYWNTSARMGEPPREVRARGFWWSGDHHLEGILIAKGPGIRRGVKIDAATVYDFTPTVMYAAGLPVPEGLDGRVIQQTFDDEFIAHHPVQVDALAQSAAVDRAELSKSEEELIEEKLRGLGYL
ncbi:MAG TPA: alkaline phosphatase family protein [Blastocatellia bacterium]|nr:alkaline phosphatase family protein [Blastocatellia bacterium]